jgi:hypothetical protein
MLYFAATLEAIEAMTAEAILNAASRFSMPWRRAIQAKSLLLEQLWPDSRDRDSKQACSDAQLSSAAGENSSRFHLRPRWPSV